MAKKFKQKKYLLFAGLIAIALGLLIEGLLISLRYEWLWAWYEEVRSVLIDIENRIATLDKIWEFIGAILLLYIVKCFVPIYTASTLCFLTGIVLPIYLAIPVNLIGLIVQFTIRYYWGKRFGARGNWRLIKKIDWLEDIVVSQGTGNPALLTALRLIPSVPVNSISSIYGSMNFNFTKFLVLSVVGFLPKLVSFTYVGRNMLDPLSPGFLIPLMIICFFSGLCLLSVNGLWSAVEYVMTLFSRFKTDKEDVK